MANGQLSDNVLNFAKPRADLHGLPISLILQEYLVKAGLMDKKP
jgi:hypothetical protein